MNNLNQQLTLLRLAGWKKWDGVYLGGWCSSHDRWDWINPEGARCSCEWPKGKIPPIFPNYLNDLNAIYELENDLFDTGNVTDPNHVRYAYSRELYKVVQPLSRQPMRATARHRAEAILRAFNLYE